MAEHLAIDKNFLVVDVYFNNTKAALVLFRDKAGELVFFKKEPNITFTAHDAINKPHWKSNSIKVGNSSFVGVVLRSKRRFTGKLTVEIKSR